MVVTRHRLFVPILVFMVLASAAIVALALALRPGLSGPAAAALEQVQAAAGQRPANRTDRLIWDAQQRLRKAPDDAEAAAALGWAYIQKVRETGDPTYYGKAKAVLDDALRRDPANIEALIGKGTLALAQHQFRDALRLGEQARALNPTVPRVYGVIADAQTELGMYDEAVATLQSMLDMRPDLASYSRAAYARELHGDLDGAIEAMRLAVSAGGPTSENTEWTRVQLGHLFFAKGDLKSAEIAYQTSLARLPDYVYALAGLGRVRAAQGQLDEAVALYGRAIQRMPLPEFVIALGETLEAAGRTEEAARQYALVGAMQQLFAANGVDTDLELALFNADHGHDPQAAVALARAAYERRPSIKAADTLAWALYKAGQPAEARRYADDALRLGTKDSLMLFHAGMIAKAQGDRTTARARLGEALALNPNFSPLYAPQARVALAELTR
jgi:tetratricopeptide (TPR) repeat protein